MRTLTITTALLAGCTTQAIGNTEYDEIARMVGTTITMPESGGDVGAAADTALLALGEMPAGMVDRGGMAIGTRAGLDVVYMAWCTDALGAQLQRCGPTAATATVIGQWTGDLALGDLSGTIARGGQWTLTGIASGAAMLIGTANFEIDASFAATSANYHLTVTETTALQVDMAMDAVVGGMVASTVAADREVDTGHGAQSWHYDVDAQVTFPDRTHAILVLDGAHTYDLVIMYIR